MRTTGLNFTFERLEPRTLLSVVAPAGERHLIIASDHNQGVMLPLSLSENYDMPKLTSRITRLMGLGASADDDA